MSAIGIAKVVEGLREMMETGTVGDRRMIRDLSNDLDYALETGDASDDYHYGYIDADGIRGLIGALAEADGFETTPDEDAEFDRRVAESQSERRLAHLEGACLDWLEDLRRKLTDSLGAAVVKFPDIVRRELSKIEAEIDRHRAA